MSHKVLSLFKGLLGQNVLSTAVPPPQHYSSRKKKQEENITKNNTPQVGAIEQLKFNKAQR